MTSLNSKTDSATLLKAALKPRVEPISHVGFRKATDWLRRSLRLSDTKVFSNRQKARGTVSVKLYTIRADRMPSDTQIKHAITKLPETARPIRWVIGNRVGGISKYKSLTFYFDPKSFSLLNIGDVDVGTEPEREPVKVKAPKPPKGARIVGTSLVYPQEEVLLPGDKLVKLLEDAATALRKHNSGEKRMKVTHVSVNAAKPRNLRLAADSAACTPVLLWDQGKKSCQAGISVHVFVALRDGLGLPVIV